MNEKRNEILKEVAAEYNSAIRNCYFIKENFYSDGKLNLEKLLTYSNDSWCKFHSLFSHIIRLKKTVRGESGLKVDTTDIYGELKDIIIKSTNINLLSIKGLAKSGKSTFLAILAMYLLKEFSLNNTNHLVYYFNVAQGQESETIAPQLEKLLKFRRSYNYPAVLIIDGLSEHKDTENDLNETIANLLSRHCSAHSSDRVIYASDMGMNFNFDRSSRIKTEYIMYFNPINLSLDGENENNHSLHSFLEIYNEKLNKHSAIDLNSFINFISHTLGITTIDLGTIAHYAKYYKNSDHGCKIVNLYTLYNDYKNEKLEKDMRSCAPKAAYFLLHEKGIKNYTDLIQIAHISEKAFNSIKNDRFLTYHLIAEYYISNIINYNKGNAYNMNALNLLLNKNESQFILAHLTHNTEAIEELKTFFISLINIDIHTEEDLLFFNGISTTIHLLSRVIPDFSLIFEYLNKASNKCMVYNKIFPNNPTIRNAWRSCYIGKIVYSTNNSDYKKQYIMLLLSDESERNINKSFHKYYYLDPVSQPFSFEDEISEGFDFYNTHRHLLFYIEQDLFTGRSSPLLEVQLFTLCNFVQYRLEKPFVGTHAGLLNYFYNRDKYPESIDILRNLNTIVEKYLSLYTDDSQIILIDYFKSFVDDLSDFLRVCSMNLVGDITDKTMKLSTTPRLGWKIKEKHNSLTQFELTQLTEVNSLESVSDHILATYYIGLFFLPSTLNDCPNYNKQEILNLILIHDLGESHTGDFPPYFENFSFEKNKEDQYMRSLLMKGIYSSFSDDLINYYRLWVAYQDNDGSNVNVCVARDLDIIQMLYKFKTMKESDKSKFSAVRAEEICNMQNKLRTALGIEIAQKLLRDKTEIVEVRELNTHIENDLHSNIDIAILTILPEESQAVLSMSSNAVEKTIHRRKYQLFNLDIGKHNTSFVHHQIQNQGNVPAGIACTNLIRDYNPQIIVVLGIAGAISNQLNLGDVVIANQVIYYDLRKTNEETVTRKLPLGGDLGLEVNQVINEYITKHGTDNISIYANNRKINVLSGPIGCGESVLKSSSSNERKWLLDTDSTTLAVEMESYGVSRGVWEANDRHKLFVIRGISDHANKNKDDSFKRIASQNAVAVLHDILPLIIKQLIIEGS